MSIPSLMVDVDEADAPFNHPSGEETCPCEGGFLGFATVGIECCRGLTFQVHQFRSAGLEAERHLVCIQSRLDLGIPDPI